MHHQHIARGEVRKQVLAPSSEPGDGAALDARGKVLRQRPAQIRPTRLDLHEARAVHRRFEAAAHGFDFGEFRHRVYLTLDRDLIAPQRSSRYGLGEKGRSAGKITAMAKSAGEADAHFGFRQVPIEDKQALVDDVFGSVARRYDLM